MAVYRIGVCDDEKSMLKINQKYLREIDLEDDEFELEIYNFIRGKDMVVYMKKNPLDIAILDIDIIDMTGIEIARELRKQNPNVTLFFLTGHAEYALDAFDVEAVGYLVKPVSKEKLAHVLKNAIVQVKARQNLVAPRELVITEENKKKKILVNDIIYVERFKSKCIIYTEKEEYQVYDTITALTEKLGEGFVRVSQSFLVRVAAIDGVTYKEVTLKDGTTFSLGRQYVQEVKKAFLSCEE